MEFGCGTSLEGNAVLMKRGILCDMSRMDKIVILEQDLLRTIKRKFTYSGTCFYGRRKFWLK